MCALEPWPASMQPSTHHINSTSLQSFARMEEPATFQCEHLFVGSSVQHVRAGICHPIICKTSLPRKRSMPSSFRFRKCFHLSCVTTAVCHPLTDLFRSLPPYYVSMYSSLPRGACRPLRVVIYVVHVFVPWKGLLPFMSYFSDT